MPATDIPGFTTRAEAITKYGGSKSSLLRNLKDAYAKEDKEVLESFRAYFSDGDYISYDAGLNVTDENGEELDGMDAIDKLIAEKTESLGNKRYLVYIKTSLLESGTLNKYKRTKQAQKNDNKPKQAPHQPRGESKQPTRRLSGASEITQLEHELEVERRDNAAKTEKIASLEKDKAYFQGATEKLQSALAKKGDEIKEFKELIDTIKPLLPGQGESETGAENTKPQGDTDTTGASESEAKVIDAESVPVEPRQPGWWERNTPSLPNIRRGVSKAAQFIRRS